MSNLPNSAALERISKLLDAGSFVELGKYVTARTTDFNMTSEETPSDGVITGYGTINEQLVYVYSQDANVLAGSMGEMHAKKITHIYEQAMKMGAPVIGLIDCAGLRLQEGADALDSFGKLYMAQTMASGVIPQLQAVFGSCGGGMAVASALADFTFMESKKAKLFVNAPNTIIGNHEDKLDTAAAKYQSEETGLCDFAGSEDEIIAQLRNLVMILPANNEDDMSYSECTDDLNRVIPGLETVESAADKLRHISDNNFFLEIKKDFGVGMVTGFIRLNGCTIGAVANEYDKLSVEGCRKAAEFVSFCDAFDIPVLTLTAVTGYCQCPGAEKRLAKAAAKLTYAFADATVPKVNVIVGKAFGSAYVTMNSSALGADMVYAWPKAEIGMMDADTAKKALGADILTGVKDAARRGYVDDIIEPADTRKRVIAAFEMLFTKREDRPAKKHGSK